MITLRRSLRPLERAHGVKLRVSYGKVAEYQRRGVVHFHALHPPRPPSTPPTRMRYSPHPTGITAADLGELVADAAATTAFRTPDYPTPTHSWPIDWGPQLDIRPLGARRRPDHLRGRRRLPGQVRHQGHRTHRAADHRPDDRRNRRALQRPRHPPRPAHRLRLANSAPAPAGWTTEQQQAGLARHLGPAAPLDAHARLRRPLRHQEPPLLHHPQGPARRPPHLATHPTARTGATATTPTHDHDDDETTLIVCDLTLAGIGWNTTADAQLAADAAARAREHRALAREERTTA